MDRRCFAFGLGLTASVVFGGTAAQAQEPCVDGNFAGQEDWAHFQGANIVASGMPVIPLMHGWIPNPDGSATIDFGYLNMNYDEAFHIPFGPDNFIVPEEFDGVQPTYFKPATYESGRRMRHQSVFAVTIPEDFDRDVVWTLRVNGRTVCVPGRAVSESYVMDDVFSGTRAEGGGMDVGGTSAPSAASLRLEAEGQEARGRVGIITGPMSATVGEPLELNVWVDLHDRPSTTLYWFPHQGPADVMFEPQQVEVVEEGRVTTTAIFQEPGDYRIRVTALENRSALVQFCCWTNAYVQVTVSP